MTFSKDLLVVDIETTGLDPGVYSICSIGAVLLDKSDLKIKDSYYSIVRPSTILKDNEEKKTFKIHGISLEQMIKEGKSFPVVMAELKAKYGKKVIPASWGNYFDFEFLKAQCKRQEIEYPFLQRSIDIKSIVEWELHKRNVQIKSMGLFDVMGILGIFPVGKHHNALFDAINTARILQYLDITHKE